MAAVFVAHPDDEALWCGGLISRFRHVRWTIVCCSIPRRDTIRAVKFYGSCEALGAVPVLLPYVESEPNTELPYLDAILAEAAVGLVNYDIVVTHGVAGEYGHIHHKQLHRALASLVPKHLIAIGYRQGGEGKHVLELTPEEQARKMMALRAYDHVLPYDGKDWPKWQALLHRYGVVEKLDLFRESYDVID